MGNSLDCGAALGGDAAAASAAWACNGTTRMTSGDPCVFPFMLHREGQDNEVFSTCMSFQEAIPPGMETALVDPRAFWCPSTEDVGAGFSNASHIGTCACEAVPEEEDNKWVIGVIFSILSSICTTIGTLLQKIAHNINDRKPEGQKAREFMGILFSPAWLCAFMLMVLLPLPFDFVALALAAQSLLVVFAGLTIALNLVFAQIMLGEKADRIEVVATFIIIIGLVFSTVSGAKVDVNYGICELLDRYTDLDFIAGAVTLSCGILIMLYFIHLAPQTRLVVRLKPVMYAFCAGGFGGLGNILFKATGELAEGGLSAEGTSSWTTVHPYYHIVLTIIFAVLQIAHINQGLRRYNAVLYLPLYNCMYILLSGTMGALTYREFDSYTKTQFILFPFGVLITLSGILVMTQKDPNSSGAEVKVAPGKPQVQPSELPA
mmetsp:Transcript_20352/g.58037  ORF Transcript_20352/g.58037 Transcript_20352/m.58037 type:complete len:433 (-) Transcript_20352:22-1320(-)